MTTSIDTSRYHRARLSGESGSEDATAHCRPEPRPTDSPATQRAAARAAREDRAAGASDGGAAPSDSSHSAIRDLLGTLAAVRSGATAGGAQKEQRVETARAAVATLARELPGHGVDTGVLAARFADDRYAAMSPSQLRSQATASFVKAALTAHPELADAMIAVRLQGVGSERRELVGLAVAASGAHGWLRYAAAESALGAAASLDQQESREVVAMMRAGMSFRAAVATQQREVAAADGWAASHRSLEAQKHNAVDDAQRQKAQVAQLLSSVNTAYRSVPVLSRAAELTVGVGASLGTVGAVGAAEVEATIRRDAAPIRTAFERAGNAGGYMWGELSDKIRRAGGTYAKFQNQYLEYIAVNEQYQAALGSQDHEEIVSTSKRMAVLLPELKATAEALGAQAEVIGRENKDFDGAAIHAAIHLAVSAVTLGCGGFPGEHNVSHAVATRLADAMSPEAANLVGDAAATVYATTAEGAVVRGGSALAHHE